MPAWISVYRFKNLVQLEIHPLQSVCHISWDICVGTNRKILLTENLKFPIYGYY